ncbi:MAG: hypothetical protein LBC92_04305, partial [Rickettsiales bacterium]|nr:hypothetical protein [Rickettsiales bacterium]
MDLNNIYTSSDFIKYLYLKDIYGTDKQGARREVLEQVEEILKDISNFLDVDLDNEIKIISNVENYNLNDLKMSAPIKGHRRCVSFSDTIIQNNVSLKNAIDLVLNKIKESIAARYVNNLYEKNMVESSVEKETLISFLSDEFKGSIKDDNKRVKFLKLLNIQDSKSLFSKLQHKYFVKSHEFARKMVKTTNAPKEVSPMLLFRNVHFNSKDDSKNYVNELFKNGGNNTAVDKCMISATTDVNVTQYYYKDNESGSNVLIIMQPKRVYDALDSYTGGLNTDSKREVSLATIDNNEVLGCVVDGRFVKNDSFIGSDDSVKDLLSQLEYNKNNEKGLLKILDKFNEGGGVKYWKFAKHSSNKKIDLVIQYINNESKIDEFIDFIWKDETIRKGFLIKNSVGEFEDIKFETKDVLKEFLKKDF